MFQESARKWEKGTETGSLPVKSYSDHPCGFMRPSEKGCEKTSLLPLWHLLKGPHFLEERPWLQSQETYSPRTLKRGGECSGITGLSSSFHQLAAPFPLSFCPVLDSNSSPSAPRLTNTEDAKMIHPAPALSPMPSQPSASIMAIVLMEVMMHSVRLSLS